MNHEERFSLDKYVAEWKRQLDTVTIEGTCHEDGDYCVIDRHPEQPGELLRVRHEDVVDRQKVRTTRARGHEHQLYRVSIKKAVPITRISIMESDRLASDSGERRFRQAISVRFRSGVEDHWTVRDEISGSVVVDRDFSQSEVYPPQDAPGILLQTSDAGFGAVAYGHDGNNLDNHRDLISGGDTIELFG
jgi:hypothetical protein